MKTARALAATAALAGVLAVLLLGPTPAGAHGGEGEAEITSITRAGDDVTVAVRLTYVEDGHGVPDATVTVVVDDGTPVPMEPGAEEGDYQATVPAAEGAAIRVTSVEPATTAEGTAPPTEEAPTTAEPDSGAEPSTTAAETTTTAAGTDEDAAGTTPTPVPDDDGDDDDGTSPVVIGAIVAVVLAVIVTAAILLTRKPRTGDGSTP